MAQFLNAAKPTGERYWHMPYYEDYSNAMKSDIADLKNTAGRAAGTLTAAAFLRAFVDDTPWIHLDIAGTAYLDTESAWQAKGPTGTPVRALVALVDAVAAAMRVSSRCTAGPSASHSTTSARRASSHCTGPGRPARSAKKRWNSRLDQISP